MRAGGDQRHENLPPTVVTGAAFTATVALLLVLLLAVLVLLVLLVLLLLLLLLLLFLLLLLLLLLLRPGPPSPRLFFSLSLARVRLLLSSAASLVSLLVACWRSPTAFCRLLISSPV